MEALVVTHLVCAGGFAGLALLVLLGRQKSRVGRYFIASCVATVIWALIGASSGFLPVGVVFAAESIRSLAWLLFMASLLTSGEAPLTQPRRQNTTAAVALFVGGGAIAIDVLHLLMPAPPGSVSAFQVMARIGIAVVGISQVENLYRNTPAERRWRIIPLCIAIGSMFAFELVLYSDAFLFRRIDPSLVAARAAIDALSVPLLTLAMARNANWRVDVHLSRNAVFHAATLVGSGVFLLVVAAVGTMFRHYGGQWALVLQVTSLAGSTILLVTILSSEAARSRLKHLILKNFYSYRYDYRAEWIRFIEALASDDATVDLSERIIRSIAHIVDSPGGVLFQRQGGALVPGAFWNARVPAEAREPVNSEFITGFKGGRWIQEIGDAAGDDVARPAWMRGNDRFWLAVPLPHHGELLGFLLLVRPRAPFSLDWEVYELLRTVAREAASHLAEEQAARALVDTELLQQYSKRFAFVVHDIKNLSSQLGLILSNARQHSGDPEFQADVLRTIENSVARMNKLLSQLKAGAAPAPQAAETDVASVLRDVISSHASSRRITAECGHTETKVRIEAEPLRSALTHLIDNALEASSTTGDIRVDLREEADRVIIDVSDHGPGMDMSYIRDELFRPFRSTKDGGYGIGAFQTRELIRAAGGELEVLSRPGSGTCMRVILRRAEPAPAQVSPAA